MIRLLVVAVVAALLVSIVELSCVADEQALPPVEPSLSPFTDAPEPELQVTVEDPGSTGRPVLAP